MLDDVTSRLLLVVTLLAAASLWFAQRRRSEGRFVRAAPPGGHRAADALSSADLGGALGGRATFVQFSTATCATCPQVRRTLADLAGRTPGVAHVEISAEDRMDLVRRFAVRRTPTVLLVGPDGLVRARTAGPVTTHEALATLEAHVPGGRRA